MSVPSAAAKGDRISHVLLRSERRWLLKYGIDVCIWLAAVPLAFLLRLETHWLRFPEGLFLLMLASVPLTVSSINLTGLYRRSWHKLGLRDLLALGGSVIATTTMLEVITLAEVITVPRSVPLITGMVALLLMSGARFATRYYFEESGRLAASKKGGRDRRVLIAGAGDSGTMIAREMLRNPKAMLRPIGFVDDASYKQRQKYVGLPVLGRIEDLSRVVKTEHVDEVVIAMPSQRGDVIRRVVKQAQLANVKHRTIPSISQLLSGKVSISQIRDVDYEDLLRRDPVRLEMDRIGSYVNGKVVLVTGAGGSIGSEIVRQLARFEPSRVVLFERSETHLYEIDMEIRERRPEIRWTAVAGDVCDRESLDDVFGRYKPTVVFHAAAYKHVPLMEMNPWQAVLNNTGGTRTLVAAAIDHAVERFVNISTDKAVNPTSVMGASKRVAEMFVTSASRQVGPNQAFVSVRFGNVLGSNGSVVPLFKKQIERGGPVTVTHPEMTRYFMTIPEASQLVLQAGSLAENGRVYVLDMGEPVKIIDLAKDLIMLSGLRLGEDIAISVTGVRPGEKLYEEILTAEEGTTSSSHEKIFVARNHSISEHVLNRLVKVLLRAARQRDEATLRKTLAKLIPENHFEHAGDGASSPVRWTVRATTPST